MCLIPWYSILCVLFANVPCAITHFLLIPIKMVITGLIICGKKAASGSKVAQRRLVVNNRSQFEPIFDQSKQFHLHWMINGSNLLEIHLHNSFLTGKKKKNSTRSFEWQMLCLMVNSWGKFPVDEKLEAMLLISMEDKNTAINYCFKHVLLSQRQWHKYWKCRWTFLGWFLWHFQT